MADCLYNPESVQFNRAAVMRCAHAHARSLKQSRAWGDETYAYLLAYGLQLAWAEAKRAAQSASERKVADLKAEIAGLDHLPLAMNAGRRRAALQAELANLRRAA